MTLSGQRQRRPTLGLELTALGTPQGTLPVFDSPKAHISSLRVKPRVGRPCPYPSEGSAPRRGGRCARRKFSPGNFWGRLKGVHITDPADRIGDSSSSRRLSTVAHRLAAAAPAPMTSPPPLAAPRSNTRIRAIMDLFYDVVSMAYRITRYYGN